MNKKVILLVILILSLTMIFAGCSDKVSTTIVNGTFDKDSFVEGENGKAFEGWQFAPDKDKAGTAYRGPEYAGSEEDKEHDSYLVIDASTSGVNYLYQSIKLKKGATYKLSMKTRIQNAINREKEIGAWVGFLEDKDFAVNVFTASQGAWKESSAYFKCSTDKTLTLAVGIGHPLQGKAKGTAFFDDITLEELDKDAIASLGLKESDIHDVKISDDRVARSDAGSTAGVVIGAILIALIMLGFMYVYRKTMTKEMLSSHKMLSPLALFIYVMLSAFIIRFVLAITTDGMLVEMTRLKNLANSIVIGNGTYGAPIPAGMMYLLFIINAIAKPLNISLDSFSMLIRLPFILADLVAIYLIYTMVSKRQKEHTAIFAAGLYAVLPSIIMASTGWGMTISLVGCLLIAMFYCMLNRNYIGTSILFTVSLLFSNLTILVLPLVLAFLINALIKYKDSRLKISITSVSCLVAFYVLYVPFVWKGLGNNPFMMFKLMWKDLTALTVLTSNAFGLYGMVGQNMMPMNTALNVLNYIFVIVLMTLTVLLYVKNRDRLNIILMAAFTLISISTLSVRGSVETMVLGIILLLAYAVIANSRRIYGLVGGFSILSFLNLALIMSNSGMISGHPNADKIFNFARTDAAFVTFSVFAVLMTFYLGYVVFDVCYRERDYEIAPMRGKLIDDCKERYANFKNRKAIQNNDIED